MVRAVAIPSSGTHRQPVLLLVVLTVGLRLVVDQHVGVEGEVALVEDHLVLVALLEEVALAERPPHVEGRADAVERVRA